MKAKWAGRCPICLELFPEGADVRHTEQGWAHEVCPDEDPLPTKFKGTTLEEMGF